MQQMHKILSNIHTHTTYCDGKATPEAIVKHAASLGYVSVGFSGHSYTDFDESYCMSRAGTADYRTEIARLAVQWKDRIDVLCGTEQDYFSCADTAGYDFVIGSVHYIQKDGAYLPVDKSAADMEENVRRYYGGDYYRYIADYYTLAADIPAKTGADVIGHFDVVTKYNEGDRYFSTADKRYRDAAFSALHAAAEAGIPFEINTGAMYRGCRTAPYPSDTLLRELCAVGGEILFSSDSHDTPSLGYAFHEAAELARACGFTHAKILRKTGFVDIAL